MRFLTLVLAVCGAASLAATPARAFDIQGENASLENEAPANQFMSPASPSSDFFSDFTRGSSLALPYIGKSESDYVSDYGNAIPIPGPGIDRASPAWAYSPRY